MHTRLCTVLLLIAVAAGAAQAIDCPDLFGGVAQDATNAVVRDCTGALVSLDEKASCLGWFNVMLLLSLP